MHFENEEVIEGRRFFLYSFQVPHSRSQYHIKGSEGWLITAYSGTFLLDPQDPDIVNLTVRTDELPASTSSCQAISEVDYGRIPIHDRAVLIPSETRLRMIDQSGDESFSSTKYADCREFASQSRMLLEVPPSAGGALVQQSSPALPAVLPAGVHFDCRVTTPLDSDTAAAGDPFEAVLRTTIRNKEHAVLAPAGTRLRGRLLRVEQRGGQTQIALQFETMDVRGATIPLRATPDLTQLRQNRYVAGTMFISRDRSSPESATIAFHGEHLHLSQFDWGWTTLPSDNKK
jgi:hypothetical protein